MLDHVRASTWHKRLGGVANAFRYGVDYVLVDADETPRGPALFARNRGNLMSLHDRDHGGLRDQGRGAVWVREVLAQHGIDLPGARILLLAQPRMLGTRFTPVSFWFVVNEKEEPVVVIPEVNNTFGHRHSYLCAHPDLRPIRPADQLDAQKNLHVSPFQPVEGRYRFNFDLNNDSVSVRIDYRHAGGGLIATLDGKRQKLTSAGIIGAAFRRPLGAARVLTLIHYQAIKLWIKRAPFWRPPVPPTEEVSR